MIFEPQVVDVTVNIDDGVNVSVEEESPIEVTADITIVHSDADYYEGDYVVTPSPDDAIILETKDKVMSDNVTVQAGGGEPNLQDKSVSYTPTESQQTATVTADSGYDGLDEVSITVGAIDSYYIGSGIPQRNSSDLVDSGRTVAVPAGFYQYPANKSIDYGVIENPIATKGAVSNNTIEVTPSVEISTAGYFKKQTNAGTAVTVSASELVSGTKSITQNGTEDVTNYASVSVAVPQPSGTKNITISANGTTTEDVTSYASASITANVPNTYSASDEGKVVNNGALVAQTSDTVTANDTYDTTLINSLTVNVSGGGGGGVDDPTDFTGGNILAIKGHGTEYIITDIYPNFVGVYATKLADNTVESYEYYWGALGTNTAYLCLQRNGTGNTITVKGMGSVSISYAGFSSGNIVTPVFSSIGMAEPATKNKPLAIGRGYYNGKIETSIAIYTFYGLNILNSNFEYTYRFVPWLDNGVACIKELISGTIYHNSGTGAYDYIDLEGVFHNA